jgi:hypothetical protein
MPSVPIARVTEAGSDSAVLRVLVAHDALTRRAPSVSLR